MPVEVRGKLPGQNAIGVYLATRYGSGISGARGSPRKKAYSQAFQEHKRNGQDGSTPVKYVANP